MLILKLVGVFVASAGTTFGLLKILDDLSNKDAKAALSAWLLSDSRLSISVITVPVLLRALVVASLSRINYLYLLAASIAFSGIATCVVIFLIAATGWNSYTPLDLFADSDARGLMLVAFVSGVIPDSLSLTKTRLVVLSDAFTRHSTLMLALDLVASIAIGMLWIVFVATPLISLIEDERPAVYAFPNFFTALAPTLLTIALVTYALLAKLALRIVRFDVRKTRRLLNYEEKPFQSLGLLVASLVGLSCALLVGLM